MPRAGITRARQVIATSFVAALVGSACLAGQSHAATPIGATFEPFGNCPAGVTSLQTTSNPSVAQYTVPSRGTITSWSFQAGGSPPQLKLKIGRPAGGNDFTIVGESAVQSPTPNALSTYPVEIPVEAGDVLGLHTASSGLCARTAPGFAYHFLSADPPPGSTNTYTAVSNGWFGVAATLEPDMAPPETSFTSVPPDKVKTFGKRVNVLFEFTSSEPDSTFECSLDGQPYEPCASPDVEKAKAKRRRGKTHVFEVRATDAAGNVDASPATDEFKAKRKRRR